MIRADQNRTSTMKRFAPFVSLLFACSLIGCARQFTVSRPAVYSSVQQRREAGLSREQQQLLDKHCPFGVPKRDVRWNFGPTDLITHNGYVLEHSAADKIPLWVCEFVEANQLTGNVARDDKFQPEPGLPLGKRAELKDYRGSGYDRGHMAPAGDQRRDANLKKETFYLSNMSPQVPALNQQIWRELEDQVRLWMIARGSGYIITGGMFYDPKEEDATTATGVVRHKAIGDGVAVPTHFYKIAVAKNANGEWQVIGFVMQNRPYKRPFQLEESIKAIDWIEQRTGLDFMPQLAPADEKRLERTPANIWN